MNINLNYLKFLSFWAVPITCCLMNIIYDGTVRCSGIFFVAIQQTFNVDRKTASFPFTLCVALRNLSGIFLGFLANRYGPGSVTLLGGILSTVGLALCYFAHGITWFTIAFGVIFGLGYGIGNVLLVFIISKTMTKGLSTAFGMSFSGCCLGSLILPPVFYFLLSNYGVHGNYLITAGLFLNTVPLSMVLIHFTSSKSRECLDLSRKRSKSEENGNSNNSAQKNQQKVSREEKPSKLSRFSKPLRAVSVDIGGDYSKYYEKASSVTRSNTISNDSSNRSCSLGSYSLEVSSAYIDSELSNEVTEVESTNSSGKVSAETSQCQSNNDSSNQDKQDPLKPNEISCIETVSKTSTNEPLKTLERFNTGFPLCKKISPTLKDSSAVVTDEHTTPEEAELSTKTTAAKLSILENPSETNGIPSEVIENKTFPLDETLKEGEPPEITLKPELLKDISVSKCNSGLIVQGSKMECNANNVAETKEISKHETKQGNANSSLKKFSESSEVCVNERFQQTHNTTKPIESCGKNNSTVATFVCSAIDMCESEKKDGVKTQEWSSVNNKSQRKSEVSDSSKKSTEVENEMESRSSTTTKSTQKNNSSISTEDSENVGPSTTDDHSSIQNDDNKFDETNQSGAVTQQDEQHRNSSSAPTNKNSLVIPNIVISGDEGHQRNTPTKPKSQKSFSALKRQNSCPPITSKRNVQANNKSTDTTKLPTLKVTVIEYSLSEESLNELQKQSQKSPKKHYRRHANSVSHKYFENADMNALGNAANWAFKENVTLKNSSRSSTGNEITKIPIEEEEMNSKFHSNKFNCKPVNKSGFLNYLRVFKNHCFLILCFCISCYEFIFMSAMTVIVDYAEDLEISNHDSRWLLMSFSIGNIFSRTCLGWVTDIGFIKRNVFAAVCFTGIALSMAGISLSLNLKALLTFCSCYGVFESGAVVMFPLLIKEYVREEDLAIAMSAYNFGPGILTLVIPIAIGFSRDVIGSYEGLFYIMIGLAIASAVLCLLLPRVHRKKNS